MLPIEAGATCCAKRCSMLIRCCCEARAELCAVAVAAPVLDVALLPEILRFCNSWFNVDSTLASVFDAPEVELTAPVPATVPVTPDVLVAPAVLAVLEVPAVLAPASVLVLEAVPDSISSSSCSNALSLPPPPP